MLFFPRIVPGCHQQLLAATSFSRMAEHDTAQASAYHNQIRRIQAALRSATWQEQQPALAFQDSVPLSSVKTNGEGKALHASSNSLQPPSVSFKSIGYRFLRERSVNLQENSRAAHKPAVSSALATTASGTAERNGTVLNAQPLSLFSSAVVSADPFGDLIAQAWGYNDKETSGTVQKHDTHTAQQSPTTEFALTTPSQSSSSAASVSSTSSSPLPTSSSLKPALLSTAEDKSLPISFRTTKPGVITAVKTTKKSSRTTPRPTQPRCSVVSVVASCPSTPLCDYQEVNAAVSNCESEKHAVQGASKPCSVSTVATKNIMSRRSSTRLASSLHGEVAEVPQSTSTTNDTSFTKTSNKWDSVKRKTVQPSPMHQRHQQRLLSRIQLLDKTLEISSSGTRSAAAASQLLRLVKDDDNKPIFGAGPVNWTAVRELREQFVRELLGRPAKEERKDATSERVLLETTQHSFHGSRAPSITKLRAASYLEQQEATTSSWTESNSGVRVEDALNRSSSDPHPFVPHETPTSPGFLDKSKSVGASVESVTLSPPAVEAVKARPFQTTDDYTASTAAFQQESEAMRRVQERLLRRRQATLDSFW